MPEHGSQESIGLDAVASDGSGQFEATLLWENIINHLEASMKCGRHIQVLRSYTNCFHGSAAVDCLLVHLTAILPKTVKREQVLILCQKLMSMGVMEDVRSKDKGGFRESRLYRLTRNHYWSASDSSLNNDPVEDKLERAQSAENLCDAKKVKKLQNDVKGYASDSTISCSVSRHHANPKRSRNSPRKKQHYSPIKKDAGFFHSLGTKASMNSGLLHASSTRVLFKGFEYTVSINPCETNDSLSPPEANHRTKLAVSRRRLLPPSMEDNTGHLIVPKRRSWSKTRENSKGHSSLSARRSIEAVKDDRDFYIISTKRGGTDKVKEDIKNHTVTFSKKLEYSSKGRENGKDSSFTNGRLDSSFLARKGSTDAGGIVGPSFATARRGSMDNGIPKLFLTRRPPPVHAKRKKSRDEPSCSKAEDKSFHCPKSSNLKIANRKTSTSKQVEKTCRIPNRRHSFSSVEDYLAGPSDCSSSSSSTDGHANRQHKWMMYGFV